MVVVVVVQLLSSVRFSETPRKAIRQATLSFTISRSLLKLISIDLMMPPNHLILCHRLLLLPPIFSSIRVFSNELVFLIRWPKYWSFSCSIIPPMNIQGWFHSPAILLWGIYLIHMKTWNFPGGLVVKTLLFHCPGHRSLLWELRSRMPCSPAKKQGKQYEGLNSQNNRYMNAYRNHSK